MSNASRDGNGADRPALAREAARGGPARRAEHRPAARPWVARFLRAATSSTWPVTGLLVVGLVVLIWEIAMTLQGVGEPTQRAGAQASVAVARPASAAAQAALAATAPPTLAAVTAVLPRGAAAVHVPARPPATATPEPPAPTSTPTPALSTASPEGVVRTFYYFLGQRDFQSVAWLFTVHMRSTMPTDPGLLRDRTPPGQLMIQQLTLLSVDQDGNGATVQIDVVEQLSPAVARRYVGNWRLVRGPAGWLLDEPDIHLE
jgi:hypothetical protein